MAALGEDTMNSRERMLAAIHHERPDRIPTDIWATPETWAKLKAHFGPDADLLSILHIDAMAGAHAKYVGPALPAVGPDESVDPWQIHTKKKGYDQGEYSETSLHPLAEATTIDDLEKFPWPQPDWFDYSVMVEPLRKSHDKQVSHVGYMAPFYYHNMLRGLEASLIDPLVEPEFTHHLLGRISDAFLTTHRRMFEVCAGLIDITEVTDDYGMQTGPMISMDTFRTFYKPHLKKFINLAHEFGITVFHHDDGAIRMFLPELVGMGIDVLNPIQWRCPGMERDRLKRDFGAKVCFHGGIDNQQTLPFGTPEDVRQEVRETIATLASDGTGYILAPCHNIQVVSPVENIIAMYDEAWKVGKLS